ncbi:sensor histidine kinase [Dactylosporangium sp. CA-052675]|uniref:sensor histidine kinase n=1 Tax=Dactylosporangium sp. CA-052675 TaxID=3239927 RepID=UPI003D912456
MVWLALLGLKLPAVALLAVPALAFTHVSAALSFPAIVVLVAGSRRLAELSREAHRRWVGVGIERPYPPRPALERTEQGWYWTGYDYHRRRAMAAVSLWFNWVGRDPATWRDLLWLAADPVVGTVLLLGGLRAHAAWTRALLAPAGSARLGARVRQLTDTRAEALDAQAAELERIERDLHDGAQARLVAIQLTLGLARRRLRKDPDGADELVREARETAAEAVRQLRDLVHGIRPPVLTERGLVDALRLLALEHPLAVTVTADLPGRPAPPLESAVYFAAAELLTNVAKHARAGGAALSVVHSGGMLRLAVSDDGIGGADPAGGTGLEGVRRRLRPFDGTLTVDSPPGGPTIATLEVPCALSSPRISSC